jgi:hypothetical protein
MSKSDFSQLTHDQLNNRVDLIEDSLQVKRMQQYNVVDSGNVLNYTTHIMKLTRGKLLKRDDWLDWQNSEILQLDQYDAQGMFGDPVATADGDGDVIFHLVWTFVIKSQMAARKPDACVTGPRARGWFRFLIRRTQTASTKPARDSSMRSPQQKTYLFLVQMSPMHFLKRLPRNRVSTYALIKPSMTGGFNIRNVCQSQPVTLFQSYLQCKANPNPRDFGRNTPTPYCGSLD